jgi:hypothetical protein
MHVTMFVCPGCTFVCTHIVRNACIVCIVCTPTYRMQPHVCVPSHHANRMYSGPNHARNRFPGVRTYRPMQRVSHEPIRLREASYCNTVTTLHCSNVNANTPQRPYHALACIAITPRGIATERTHSRDSSLYERRKRRECATALT